MRVLLAHTFPGGPVYHRVEEPARAVVGSGADVDVVVTRGIATTVRPGADGQQELVDLDDQGADVVVLQLPKTLAMLAVLRMLQARGVAVVVEIDDLLSGIQPSHPSHKTLINGGRADIVAQCAREADFVTVSTPGLLQEYARHGRGSVVPNAIPRRIAELPPAYERAPDVVTVGWTGTFAGRRHDLEEVGSGLRQALDRTAGRSRFVVLGEKGDAGVRLGLSEDPVEVPWTMDIDGYLARIGELVDVGIAPLHTDRFNVCKSWLKPLEYSARGVFCVRARTPEYERLGLGLPARAPKDWAKWVTVGIADADRRRELAAAARETVLASHLTEHTAERWLSAWQAALDHRTRARGAGSPVPAASR